MLEVRGVPAAPVRLYPFADHIADKLCATQAPYGDDETLPVGLALLANGQHQSN